MREFLSQNSVEFQDRNIAKEPHWRNELLDLTGEIVVPVLFVNGQQVIGLDEQRMDEALSLEHMQVTSNRDGLAAPPELASLPKPDDPTTAALTHFVQRLQREMEFNALKDGAPYRDGQHDGMRFARDAILRILTGAYEPEEMVIERDPDKPSA